MSPIIRAASPIDSLEHVAEDESSAIRTLARSDSSHSSDSPLSTLCTTPSPPPSGVYNLDSLPCRVPVYAHDKYRRSAPISILSSPGSDLEDYTPGIEKRPPSRCAPSPPYFPPKGYHDEPPPCPTRAAPVPGKLRRRTPRRFWTRGQEKWHRAPLDGELMSPGEYRAWEKTMVGGCHTYTMYLSAYRRRQKAKREDGGEVFTNEHGDKSVVVEEGTAEPTTEQEGQSIDEVEEDMEKDDVTIITGCEEDQIANVVKGVDEIIKISSPGEDGEVKTPGSGRRSRPIKGGSYSLTADVNRKKRSLSDGAEKESAERVKRRSVGRDGEEGDGGVKVDLKKDDDGGEKMEGVELTG
ncbi:hypothetical protein QBC41DRAFT_304975 [Cercophora samala]|uniref:Uncharacterized protein n=1 Tax=Cercophora samala TaxID=330535 RepID=A0AA39Z9F2_9PEZI|nr:hypothetical protein QBC41DRAFT_304975 [Cercophora samala]